jgi:hypothetical protein
MSSHSRAHPTAISFRPDAETIAAIARIQVMSGLQDRSAVLREFVRVMKAQSHTLEPSATAFDPFPNGA